MKKRLKEFDKLIVSVGRMPNSSDVISESFHPNK